MRARRMTFNGAPPSGPSETTAGNIEWRREDGDLPAAIYSNGDEAFYRDGEPHRDGDLPAIVTGLGTKAWYKHGMLHRDGDLPAIEFFDGRREYYLDGALDRRSGEPAVLHLKQPSRPNGGCAAAA